MNKKQKCQISHIARKLQVLSSLLEGKRIEVTMRPEAEELNWALSRSLKDLSIEIFSLVVRGKSQDEVKSGVFELVNEPSCSQES